jgi:trimethylamine--corrinoid protein Co-methyltransferase
MLSLNPVTSQQEVKRIHQRSLDILENIGIQYNTPRALEILEEKGSRVDYDKNWASISPDLVEWALKQSKREVLLAARDPEKDVLLDGNQVFHTTDSQGTQAIDLETGGLHDTTAEDLRRISLFGDALENVDIVNATVSPSDLPGHLRCLAQFKIAFENTAKPTRAGVHNAAQVPYLVELVKAVNGGEFRPIFSTVDCTISPLMHDGEMTEACIELAKLNVPIMVYPMPLAGGTSPVTHGGTVLMHNAEFLSGLVLFQAVNPGTPIIYGTGASQLDMNTGRYGGSADCVHLGLILAEMAKYYNLPKNIWGMSTRSTHLDAQYGHEATAQTLMAYLGGADEIYSVGLLGAAQILSLDKAVLDNHLIRQLEHMITPVNLDEEHLQYDLIKRVGVGGEYLTQRETLDYTRKEYLPLWPPHGQDLIKEVHQQALDILHNHQPPPLPPGADVLINEILAEADQVFKE